MSGGPVFRIVNLTKYWVVGIQSSWYPDRRVVRFCPIDAFIAALHEVEHERRSAET